MNNISRFRFRLLALRGMYLLIAVGLTLSTWAEVVNGVGKVANTDTVICAFLIGLVVLSLLGLIHPLKMIPSCCLSWCGSALGCCYMRYPCGSLGA